MTNSDFEFKHLRNLLTDSVIPKDVEKLPVSEYANSVDFIYRAFFIWENDTVSAIPVSSLSWTTQTLRPFSVPKAVLRKISSTMLYYGPIPIPLGSRFSVPHRVTVNGAGSQGQVDQVLLDGQILANPGLGGAVVYDSDSVFVNEFDFGGLISIDASVQSSFNQVVETPPLFFWNDGFSLRWEPMFFDGLAEIDPTYQFWIKTELYFSLFPQQ